MIQSTGNSLIICAVRTVLGFLDQACTLRIKCVFRILYCFVVQNKYVQDTRTLWGQSPQKSSRIRRPATTATAGVRRHVSPAAAGARARPQFSTASSNPTELFVVSRPATNVLVSMWPVRATPTD